VIIVAYYNIPSGVDRRPVADWIPMTQPTRREMPALIRPLLGFMRVTDSLRMRIASS
jgi:hypothetical protein